MKLISNKVKIAMTIIVLLIAMLVWQMPQVKKVLGLEEEQVMAKPFSPDSVRVSF